jgi:hypothetical protein
MLKKYAKNLPRAGSLALPFGSAIEKAIYGPLDEKAKENEKKELFNVIEELSKDAEFNTAKTQNKLELLANKIDDTNENLSRTIRELNPIQIDVQVRQYIQPTIINIVNQISKEDIISLFKEIGVLPSNITTEETPETLGKQLLDSTDQVGKLPELVEMLDSLYSNLIPDSENDNTEIPDEIIRELTIASQSLLAWSTTIGKDKWLEREEAYIIENRISSNEASTTLLLGKPGTGKSALLSYIAKKLIEKGFPVLGIKADMLPKSIKKLSDLQKHLKLSYPIHESLVRCNKNKSPILIIDQLDALSELVDRNSERLNVLLDLIQSVSNTKRIHVISSCRWFEYQHDVRLTTIDAEKIDLTLPSWKDIETVLKDAGFSVDGFSDETKDLCSVPLHLKILLDLKSRGADSIIPSSLQALLENIWQQRVITGEHSSDKMSLIERLSNKMAEEEELWIARAFADSNLEAFQELQRANIFMLDDAELRIGFVHQTYFDFARARAFAVDHEILSDFVIQRQDGLFVRPILLSTLAYLREVSPKKYSEELFKLWKTDDLRSHIKDLLIEYISSVENPNHTELTCLLPLFENHKQKYKALLSVPGSPGWFNAIKDTVIPSMMCEGAEFASLFIPIFSRALTFAKDDVFLLLRNYWLKDTSYDENILNLLLYLKDWDHDAVGIVIDIAKRHDSRFIPQLAEMVSQIIPELAAKIVRADLDRRWDSAIKDESKYKPPPPPETDEAEKAIYEFDNSKKNIFEGLLKRSQGWYDLSVIAETAPKAFIDSIWPWFVMVVGKIVCEPHPFVTGYQRDYCLETNPERDGVSDDLPVVTLTKAIVDLSRNQGDNFVTFFYANIESPFLAVQRILTIGLLQVAETHSQVILDYLLSNPRRMVIGDSYDQHKYTKRLISAVLPHLNKDQIKSLEDLAINWNQYYKEDPKWTAEEKIERIKWNRQDVLRILRAFPKEYSSDQLIRLKEKEERAFPKLPDCSSMFSGVHTVGSRMSHEQMSKAEDDHIINLFNTLTDDTEWNHPKGHWNFIGGSIQTSREFAAFAEKNPERASDLIMKFMPERQERPAGMGIGGLSRSNFPSVDLFTLIEVLVKKGFSTNEFRRNVAEGLRGRVQKDKGLPAHIIKLLEDWMMEDEHPKIDNKKDNDEEKTTDSSILWGGGGFFNYPGGRDTFIAPIALGYLAQESPKYSDFAVFIEKMLKHEKHPKVWQITFHWMQFLFNWNKEKATQYYDQVLKNCPDVTEDKIGIIAFADFLQLIPGNPIVQDWLMQIGSKDSNLRKQAFGELLMLYNFKNPDDQWGKKHLDTILNNAHFSREQCGVAFAASRNWHRQNYQSICTEVLVKLSTTKEEITQRAISTVFPHNEIVSFNAEMKRLIEAILNNDGILIKSAERLIEGVFSYTAIEPNIVASICSRVIEVGKDEIKNIGSSFAFVAEPIVSIALTLHRMPTPYREKGLDIFERLIESDIPNARQALNILDRKPLTSHFPTRLRRRSKKPRK